GIDVDRELPVPLTFRLRFESLTLETASDGSLELALRFSQPLRTVDPQTLATLIVIEPEVAFRPTVEKGGAELRLRGAFLPGERYRVTARKGLLGARDAVLIADVAREVEIPDRP